MVWLRLRDPTLLFPPFWPLFISNTHFPALFSQKRRGGEEFLCAEICFFTSSKNGGLENRKYQRWSLFCLSYLLQCWGEECCWPLFRSFLTVEKFGLASYACPSPEADWRVCLDRPLFIFVLAIWEMRKFYHSSKAEMLWTRIFSFDVMDWFDWTLGF